MTSELSPSQLRWTCDPKVFGAKSTEELKPLDVLLGQPRAHQALLFGFGVKDPGFNIFAPGPPGTGKTTAVTDFLEDIAQRKPAPSDWCYVHNFTDEYQPNALRCPPGMGRQLKHDMREFIDAVRLSIPQVFESEDYAAKRDQIVRHANQKRQEILGQMSQLAKEQEFLMQLTPVGISLAPVINGRPIADDEFLSLPKDLQQKISQRRETLREKLMPLTHQLRELEDKTRDEISEFDKDVALYAIEHLMSGLLEKYKANDDISKYLQEVQSHILEDLDRFRSKTGEQKESSESKWAEEAAFRVYEVNVIVDNSALKGAPVIEEDNPTFDNVLGRVEKESRFGILTTDFTLIRGGSLHQANGGYLIIRAEQLLRDINVYDGLKRALKSQEIQIEDVPQRVGYASVRSLSPKPIPLDLKVILIGDPSLYQQLFAVDPEFRELFKVKADFDYTMPRTDVNLRNYAGFFSTLVINENLKHLDASAVARLLEHGSRLAEDQNKLSTQFGLIADVVREANFYASQENSKYVTAKHVERAIEEKIYRTDLSQEKLQEYIERNVILVSTEGEAVGQVNGLSVLNVGDYAFGSPSRITVSVGLGKEGLVDVQREVNMGGPIHGKGVMIIAGYLSSKYGYDKPLTLSARVVFEQNYSGIEGDSASSTELYALLSALSGLPVKQTCAMTGSVNQKGEVQAIGGVNEKLEGYFDICKAKGLNGKHGVLIPESNVQNLMLRQEVIDAVKAGKFHIYPVKTIDEGIEILTGVPAGKQLPSGGFEPNSVHGLVDKRLREMAEKIKDFQFFAS